MKNIRFIFIAIILSGLSITAAADVKVKSRQSVSGQTTESTTYIKGKRQRSEQNTGGISSVTLTQCDLKRSVQINPQAQVYLVNSWAADNTVPAKVTKSGSTTVESKKGGVLTTTVTTKDTGETKKMFGYIARHLIVTIETESSADACSQTKSKMVTDGWYIDAAFALDCDYDRYGHIQPNPRGGCIDKYEVKQVGAAKRGYPVVEKTTMFDASGEESFTMTNEVIELSSATLDAALFDVPADYREVQDSSQMYAARTTAISNISDRSMNTSVPSTDQSGLNSTIASKSASREATPMLAEKKEGVIRIGLPAIKTGSVGDGVNAAELAAAIENTFGGYFKGTKIEIVKLEAKLSIAIEAEAADKECDFVLYAQTSHKKGGGSGFGMFTKVIAPVVSRTGIGQTGSTVGNVAGQVATQAIYSAASASANIKAKDEVTLDIKLVKGSTVAMSKQFKAKAKSAGEDIISPLVEQAATAIIEVAR
ncbi:MAG: hypothetical protein IPJ30_09185 [Acidobacteria bacterium]|nr:hypothetical protein [Acidobacteriota bacterium]